MKRLISSFVLAALLAPALVVAEEAPDSVRQLAAKLKTWGVNPTIVAAVKTQNEAGQSLDQIKQRDATWRATSGIDELMQSLLDNEAAKELGKLEKSEPYFFELFVMDNQGANVAMTNKTSDYWQGDEDKFTYSFHDGQGDVHIGEVEFDESAQAYLVQVSVPVMDGGHAIGAMTIGINIDLLEAQ
ncbi:MAG: PDC sensor domain-containing protein [Gammaproteobacteria bacterium]|nr:PDC sensor domain-containing protein [Gammaproteobacteria bacterium]